MLSLPRPARYLSPILALLPFPSLHLFISFPLSIYVILVVLSPLTPLALSFSLSRSLDSFPSMFSCLQSIASPFVLAFPSPLSLSPRFLSFASFSGSHPLSSSRSPFLYPSFSLFLFSLLQLRSFHLAFSLSPFLFCSLSFSSTPVILLPISLSYPLLPPLLCRSPSTAFHLPLCLKIGTRSPSRPHVSSSFLLSPYLSRDLTSSL